MRRGHAALGFVTITLACSTLLDFPDRTLDPELGSAGSSASGNGGAAAGGSTAGGGSGAGQSGRGGDGGGGAANSGGSGNLAGEAGAAPDASASDAQPDVPLVDAPGDGPTPGAIVCGAESCVTGGDYVCCAHQITGATACRALDDCPAPSVRRFCDEAADCPPGGVCCADLQDGTAQHFATRCRNNCVGTGTPVQICQTTAECRTGECLPRTCASGVVILACASSPACQ
jgi:hypothetical protein